MGRNLKATFQFLTKTENEAAIEVLIAGLDCPHRAIRHSAIRALLDRLSPVGHHEVFRRLPSMDKRSRAIINERPERLVHVVKDVLQNSNSQTCATACKAIVSFRLYAALPELVAVLIDSKTPHRPEVARTILKLSDLFYAELSGSGDQPKPRGQENVRRRITTSLEDAVRKFHRHKQTEVIEALLLVAKQKNVTIGYLLQHPREGSHQPLVDLLSSSSRGGVIRLLLGFLEDPKMPRVVTKVLSSRCDLKFVEHLLWTIGPRPSKTITETLSRIDSIAWAEPGNELFDKLDDAAQEGAVQLMLASSIDRQKALGVIGYLLLEGKPAGRRAAAKALEQFEGPESSTLVVKALNDEDSQVRAPLLVQLRPRRIPCALSLLIQMVDSPHKEVQLALQKALPEFTFRQFLANFDEIPEQSRPITGHLVRRIDPEVAAKVAAEMDGPSPVRRRRAVLAAGAMGLVQEMQETIIKLLSDEDHIVRVAVAKTLADCKSMPSWEALRDALLDRSVAVKEAAERSLEQISQSLLQEVEEEEQPEEVIQ